MDPIDAFARRLFFRGRVRFDSRPVLERDPQHSRLLALKRFYRIAQRDIAGKPIPFDMFAAAEALKVFKWACWGLVNRDERPDELLENLTTSLEPKSPPEHFSADLFFRYLPQICARARKINPADVLVEASERTLRRFPLSGVLAGLAEGPTTSLEFGGHPGLMMLYAERFVQHSRPAWRPSGQTLEFVELAEQDAAALKPQNHQGIA